MKPSFFPAILVPLLLPTFVPSVVAKPIPTPITADCRSLVALSTHQTFDWKSSQAVQLSQQCLLDHQPEPGTCTFYTSEARKHAILYAATHSKTTIYDVYPAHWFDNASYPASHWTSNGKMRDVFRVTSRVYAMNCAGSATLVIPRSQEVCKTSIWWMDEYAAIRGGLSSITELYKVSLMSTVGGVFRWARNKMSLASDEPSNKHGLQKRSWQSTLIPDLGINVDAALDFNLDWLTGLDRASRDILQEKLEMLNRVGNEATEWALASGDSCAT